MYHKDQIYLTKERIAQLLEELNKLESEICDLRENTSTLSILDHEVTRLKNHLIEFFDLFLKFNPEEVAKAKQELKRILNSKFIENYT